MVWWEAVLSPALQVLFDKLASGDIINFLQDCSISEFLLEKLRIAYFANSAVLEDAEAKHFHDPAVETWLDLLKDAILEAEDLLDELATEALRRQLGNNQVRSWNLIPSSLRSSEGTGDDHDGLDSRIAIIITKLEYVAGQKDLLGLKSRRDVSGQWGTSKVQIPRVPTTAILMESRVFGRDDDREEIIKLLLGNDSGISSSDDEVPVIPLLGMGGLGKTMLAQMVFNDTRVKDCFDVKAWACVSDEFDLVKVTKSILESATNRPWETTNLELLQSSLMNKLSKKKFLIVLDDVWNDNHENWDKLRSPFLAGAQGSRVIITTRSESVIDAMNAHPPYYLSELSDECCWSLLSYHAFQGQKDSRAFSQLEGVGRGVAKRCKGLPLAAKALGSLLGSKLEIGFWHEILDSDLWDISSRGSTKNTSIFPALQLSYDHLPPNLKRCFTYCSMFPKGYEFEQEKLILLWMAEGFIQDQEGNRSMEEVGHQYFTDLVSRSFFQRSDSNHGSRFIMHDLISDLARLVTRKNQCPISGKARHFSYAQGKYDVYKKFEALIEAEKLRTFLPLSSYHTGFCYLSSKVVKDLLPGLRCLRVLSLRGYCISELPEKIGCMKLLRYLDLSRTAIKCLPKSISTLCNLQTLMLNDCDSLLELPKDFSDLINLRYFDISGSGIQYMPLNMSKLRNLRTLPEFIAGNRIGSEIGDMRDLVHLQGKIVFSRLENVFNPWDARKANLSSKKGISELMLEWSSNFDELQDPTVQTDIFEMLQPQRKLERLSIRYFSGMRFSTWLGDPSFSSMVFLNLENCRKCSSLPPLGQLSSLRQLYIKGLSTVKNVGLEFYGDTDKPFPSLEILRFRDMLEWDQWISYQTGDEDEIKAFPSLRELYIEQCDKLRGRLPSDLPSLEKLVIHGAEQWFVPLQGLKSLRQLDIKGCHAVFLRRTALDLSSLSYLYISGILNLTYLPLETMQVLRQLQVLQISDCSNLEYLSRDELSFVYMSSLQSLIVRHCPVLISLSKKEQKLPANLKYLELENCSSLKNLPENLHNIPLREITIRDCPELVSLPDSSFPPMLRGLAIRQCGLQTLPKETIHCIGSCLEYLYISGCYNLTSFPSSGGHMIATPFQQLVIDHCPNLQSLPNGIMLGSNTVLKVLEIFDCSSLKSLPIGQLPASLKTLTIFNCSSLESLAEILGQDNRDTALESFRVGKCTGLKHLPKGLHKLSSLEYLEVDWCPLLESFPDGGLPAANLKKVRITSCENLKALPSGMQNLTSLQELSISDCPKIASLPERGLPIGLTSLEVKDCENISNLSKWGLERLESLKKLCVIGGNLGLSNFPEWMLPPSLTSLQLEKLPNLDFQTNWLQNLTLLEDLKLKDCKKLQCLPVEGLPVTLSHLEIRGCPLIEQQCEKEWEKIDHIPCILM